MKKILTSSHLQKLLEHKYDIIKEFKKIHFDEFCQYLYRIKELDDLNQSKVQGIRNNLNRMALLNTRPIDDIVFTYQKGYFRGFDQDIFAMNIKTLGSIFEFFQKDGMLYSGHENKKHIMFFEDRFHNMMNDTRFAFQQNTNIQNKNLALIVEGLSRIGYIQKQFVDQIIQKFSTIAKGNDVSQDIDTGKKYFQMDRLFYYGQGYPVNRNKLVNSQNFNRILSEILNNSQLKHQKNNSSPVTFDQLSSEDQQTIHNLLQSISQQIDKTSENISKFVESVISLRLKYIQMVQASSYKQVSSDPNLNTQLLDLEETLIQLKLLKIQQIKDSQSILNKQKFLQNTKSIIIEFLQNPQQNMSEYFSLVLQKNNPISIQYVNVPSNINKQIHYFGKLLSSVSQYLNTQSREIKRDGIIQSQWKSQIIQNSTPSFTKNRNNFMLPQNQYELNTDRAFKRIYHQFIDYLQGRGVNEHLQYLKKATNPIHTVSYIRGLIHVGLQERALQLINELNVKNIQLNQSFKQKNFKQQVISLVQIISTFSQTSDFENLNKQLISIIQVYLKEGKLLQSKWRVQQGGEGWGIHELCSIINWLQNTNNVSSSLSDSLIALLKQQVQTIGLLVIHKNYNEIVSILNISGQSYKHCYDTKKYYNPALEFIKQKVITQLGVQNPSDAASQQMISLGYSNLQDNKLHQLVFLSSMFSSYNGKYINHNIKAHYKRLQRVNNVKITTVPFTKLVKYNKQKQDFVMKSPQQLNEVLLQIKSNGELFKVSQYLKDIVIKIQNIIKNQTSISFSPQDQKALSKLLSDIRQINAFSRKEISIQNQNVGKINRHKIAYSLMKLEKDFKYLSEEIKNKVENAISKSQLQAFIKSIIPQTGVSINEKEPIFSGLRQTIDTFSTSEIPESKSNFTDHVLDIQFIQNDKYHQYQDWRKEIQQALGIYNSAQISIDDCSEFTKMMHFGKSTLSIPVLQPRKIITSPYTYNWDKLYKQAPQKELDQALQLQQLVKQQQYFKNNQTLNDSIGMKVSLQNFKYQLKHDRSKNDVADLLLKFDFIESLIDQHLPNDQQFTQNYNGLLERDAKSYFEYLAERPYQKLFSSPYLSYIFSKISKKSQLKQLLLYNKYKTRQLLNKARLNEITPTQFNQLTDALHSKTLKAIESYKDQILDEQFVTLKDNTNVIVKPNVNEQQFSRLLMLRLNPYNMQEDVDVILSNGQYQEALDRKRSKQQQKLIKLRIILKLNRGLKLSQKEQNYLKYWKRSKSSDQSKQQFRFSNKTINNLSEKDKQLLKSFEYSSDIATKYADSLRLSDLTFELGHFYSNQTLMEFDGRLQLKQYQQKYLVNKEQITSIFSNSLEINQSSIIGNYLLELEKSKFDQQSKFKNQQIDNILQISKFLKTQVALNKKIYDHVYKNGKQELNQLNKLPNRNQSISQWYRLKEQQYDHAYHLGEEGIKRKDQQVAQAWRSLTGKQISNTTKLQLSNLVHSICERLFIFKRNCPPFLSNLISKILTHPQLSYLDRCVLLGSIQLTKFPISIDSRDIVELSKVAVSQTISTDEVKTKIEQSRSKLTSEQATYVYV